MSTPTPILGTFFLASAGEIQEGLDWYRLANLITCRIARDYNISILKVAGVISALSPQNPWERNVQDAENMVKLYSIDPSSVDDLKVGTFGANKRKAIQILSSNGEIETIADILNGRKQQAFYRCILHQDDVCVDGHAYSIWIGKRVSTTDTPKISAKLYQEIASDYREATAIINRIMGTNYTSYQVQAITWVTHRNLYKGVRK